MHAVGSPFPFGIETQTPPPPPPPPQHPPDPARSEQKETNSEGFGVYRYCLSWAVTIDHKPLNPKPYTLNSSGTGEVIVRGALGRGRVRVWGSLENEKSGFP